MQRIGQYTAQDFMSDMVSDNYRILPVMSRFGIGLGIGDKTIDQVCGENGIDTTTFIIIANMHLFGESAAYSVDTVSLPSLLDYLHSSHEYFLGFKLPAIRRKLTEIVGDAEDLPKAIIRYFDEYTRGVRAHMKYEDDVVFPYVRSLLADTPADDYNIDIFRQRHDHVEALLTEFKNILIKYYPSQSTNELNGVLFDIFDCEADLASHNYIEDNLFVPAVKAAEKKAKESRR